MKNCNEITRDLLKRRDEYAAKQRRRRKTAVVSAACFCLIAGVGLGLWRGGVFTPGHTVQSESSPPKCIMRGTPSVFRQLSCRKRRKAYLPT